MKFVACCSPTYKGFRFIVLLVDVFLTFGSALSAFFFMLSFESNQIKYFIPNRLRKIHKPEYFAYDEISALSSHIRKDLGISPVEYGLLFSLYSVPGIIMPFIGGIIIARIGVRSTTLIFSCIVTIGALIVAVSSSIRSFPLMLIGRLVFGFGAEPLETSQSAITSKWFRHKEIALAFALQITVSRIGTFAAFVLEDMIAHVTGSYRYSLYFGVIVCVFSLILAVVYFVLDRAEDRFRSSLSRSSSKQSLISNAVESVDEPLTPSRRLSLRKVSLHSEGIEEEQIHQAEVHEQVSLKSEPQPQLQPEPPKKKAEDGGGGHSVHWKDIKDLPIAFWLIAAIICTFYVTVVPFSSVASEFIQDKYEYSQGKANLTTAIVTLVAVFGNTFFGVLIDKFGQRPKVALFAVIIIIPSYLALCLTRYPPQVPIAIIGVAFAAISTAMWPCVALVMPVPELTGAGFGIIFSMISASSLAMNLIQGHFKQKYGNYEPALLLSVGTQIICLGLCVLFQVLDIAWWKGRMSSRRPQEVPKEAIKSSNNPSPEKPTRGSIAEDTPLLS